MATPEDTAVLVTRDDFERALHDLVPSVSPSEMDHYKHIQHRFSRKSIGVENDIERGNDMKGKGRAVY